MRPIFQPSRFSLLLLLALTACEETQPPNREGRIVSIPEASGISYCHNSETLMVANDEGSFYEITPDGAILSQHKLGNHDLEGVVCEEESIIFAVEDGALIEVDRETFQLKELKIKGKKFKFSKKSGIEGITKIGDKYYLSIQAKEKKDAKLLVIEKGVNYAKIVKIIDHGIIDSAGMEYHNKKLYIVSDKKDKLYLYNLKKNSIQKSVKLPKFAQEGVTFDKQGNIYFADDDGAVMKYRLKTLGL